MFRCSCMRILYSERHFHRVFGIVSILYLLSLPKALHRNNLHLHIYTYDLKYYRIYTFITFKLKFIIILKHHIWNYNFALFNLHNNVQYSVSWQEPHVWPIPSSQALHLWQGSQLLVAEQNVLDPVHWECEEHAPIKME